MGSRRSSFRPGFTLVELVAVLLILTILATIALETIEPQVDQARFETTQRTVQNVSEAIFDQSQSSDGRLVMTGFYADVGRLPQALADPLDPTVLTVRELWDPATVPLYATRLASPDNVSTVTDADGDTIVADSKVELTFGWRGPYLRLPVGADGLRDGWANPMVSFTSYVDSATYPHLRGPGDSDLTSAGAPVLGIRSLGADDIEDTLVAPDTYERDLPTIGNGVSLNQSMLLGRVSGIVYVNSSVGATDSDVVVQIYYPDPDPTLPGKIAVQRATVSARGSSMTAYDLFDFRFEDSAGGNLQLPIGSRVIRAYFNDSNNPDGSGDFGDGTTDPANVSLSTPFTLAPHDNSIELTIN